VNAAVNTGRTECVALRNQRRRMELNRSRSRRLHIRSASAGVSGGRSVSYDVVSVYTLMLGDEEGPATVSVHATAEEAWRALDSEVRARCGLRPRPRRVIDPEAATRLADAWRAGDVSGRSIPIRSP
jgi:hypothetical protein